jgi:hypothetical protein
MSPIPPAVIGDLRSQAVKTQWEQAFDPTAVFDPSGFLAGFL